MSLEEAIAPDCVVRVVGLRKSLGGRPVLDGITFDVARGSSSVIVGPSGCGKSTLLRCLNGLECPDAGTVRVGGVTLARTPPPSARALRALRQRVGLVFQQWNLFGHRTVLGNVMEGPIRVARKSPAQAMAEARGLLARVGIAHRADAFPHQLSGGEQQRTAIARALAMHPEVLLLDEPTSALDAVRVAELIVLLNELRATGLTLVSVTHDERIHRGLGERILHMEGGKLASP